MSDQKQRTRELQFFIQGVKHWIIAWLWQKISKIWSDKSLPYKIVDQTQYRPPDLLIYNSSYGRSKFVVANFFDDKTPKSQNKWTFSTENEGGLYWIWLTNLVATRNKKNRNRSSSESHARWLWSLKSVVYSKLNNFLYILFFQNLFSLASRILNYLSNDGINSFIGLKLFDVLTFKLDNFLTSEILRFGDFPLMASRFNLEFSWTGFQKKV